MRRFLNWLRGLFRKRKPAPRRHLYYPKPSPKAQALVDEWLEEMNRRSLRQDPTGASAHCILVSNLARLIAKERGQVKELYLNERTK